MPPWRFLCAFLVQLQLMICFISARPVGYHLSAAEQSHDESDTTSSLLPEVITTLMPEVPVQSTALPVQKEHSSPPARTDNSLSRNLMNKILSTGRATTRKPHRCDDHCKISCSQVSTEALDYYDSCRNQDNCDGKPDECDTSRTSTWISYLPLLLVATILIIYPYCCRGRSMCKNDDCEHTTAMFSNSCNCVAKYCKESQLLAKK